MTLVTVSTLAVADERSVARRHVLGRVSFEVRDFPSVDAPVAMVLSGSSGLVSDAFKHDLVVPFRLINGQLYEPVPKNPYENVLGRLLMNGAGLSGEDARRFEKRSGNPDGVLRGNDRLAIAPDPMMLEVDLSQTERGQNVSALGSKKLVCVDGEVLLPSMGPVFVLSPRPGSFHGHWPIHGFWTTSTLGLINRDYRRGLFRYDHQDEMADSALRTNLPIDFNGCGDIQWQGSLPQVMPDDLDIRAEAIAARLLRAFDEKTASAMEVEVFEKVVALRTDMDARLGIGWEQTMVNPFSSMPDIFNPLEVRPEDHLVETVGDLIIALREAAGPAESLAFNDYEAMLSAGTLRELANVSLAGL